jgi:hypothetical protein
VKGTSLTSAQDGGFVTSILQRIGALSFSPLIHGSLFVQSRAERFFQYVYVPDAQIGAQARLGSEYVPQG